MKNSLSFKASLSTSLVIIFLLMMSSFQVMAKTSIVDSDLNVTAITKNDKGYLYALSLKDKKGKPIVGQMLTLKGGSGSSSNCVSGSLGTCTLFLPQELDRAFDAFAGDSQLERPILNSNVNLKSSGNPQIQANGDGVPANSFITITPSVAFPVVGINSFQIEVTVLDGSNVPSAGEEVTYAATSQVDFNDGDGIGGSSSCFTGGDGKCNLVATSTLAIEHMTILTIQNGDIDTAAYTFIADVADATTSTVVSTTSPNPVAGVASHSLTATIRDQYGNLVTGETVTFAATTLVSLGGGVVGVDTATCSTIADGTCSVTAESTKADMQFSTDVTINGVGGDSLTGTIPANQTSPVLYTFDPGAPHAMFTTFGIGAMDSDSIAGTTIDYNADIKDINNNTVKDGLSVVFGSSNLATTNVSESVTCAGGTVSGVCSTTNTGTLIGISQLDALTVDGIDVTPASSPHQTEWHPTAPDATNSTFGVNFSARTVIQNVTYRAVLQDEYTNLLEDNAVVTFSLSNNGTSSNAPTSITCTLLSGDGSCTTATVNSSKVGETIVAASADDLINASVSINTNTLDAGNTTVWNPDVPADLFSSYGVSSSSLTAGSPITYRAIIKDQFDNLVDDTSGYTVSFTPDNAPTSANAPTTVLTCPTVSGACSTVLNPITSTLVGTTTVSASVNGLSLTNATLDSGNSTTWTAGVANTTFSTFGASHEFQTAGSSVSYSAEIRDENNNLITGTPTVIFTLTDLLGATSLGDASTQTIDCQISNGICTTANVTSDLVGETVVTAEISGGITLINNTLLFPKTTWQSGKPDVASSSFSVSDTTRVAGVEFVTYSAVIEDVKGNPVADGYTVTFTLDDAASGADAEANFPTLTCITNEATFGLGMCSTTENVTSTKVGNTKVNATANDQFDTLGTDFSLGAELSTDWTVGAANGAASEFSVDLGTQTVGQNVNYSAVITDQFGNPVGINVDVYFTMANTDANTPPVSCMTDAGGLCNVNAFSTQTNTTNTGETIASASLDMAGLDLIPLALGQNDRTTWISDDPSVTPPDGSFLSIVANSAIADGLAINIFQVTVSDQFGNPIPSQTVNFTTDPLVDLSAPSCFTGGAGTCTINATSEKAGSYLLNATLAFDASALTALAYEFVPGKPTADFSTYTVSSTSITAGDGVTYSALIKDAKDNLVAAGYTVTFTLTDNGTANAQASFPTVSCITDGVGACSTTLTPITSTLIGSTDVTASVNDQTDNNGTDVSFDGMKSTQWNSGLPHEDFSTFSASTNSTTVGNFVTYSAIIKDENENLVADNFVVTFTLADNGTGANAETNFSPVTCTTDELTYGLGECTTAVNTVTSTKVGRTTVEASVNDNMTNDISLTVTGDDFTDWTVGGPSAYNSEYSVNLATQTVGQPIVYSAIVRDAFNNTVELATVNFSLANTNANAPINGLVGISCDTDANGECSFTDPDLTSTMTTWDSMGTTQVTAFVNGVEPITGANITNDTTITPDTIYGSGNANGHFTKDSNNGIEIGLRAKYPTVAYSTDPMMPDPILNGDGTYNIDAGVTWNFDWTINTNFDGNGANLNLYTYELGLDGDPGIGVDYLAFDPVTLAPSLIPPFWDHSIGDNSTINDMGEEAISTANYLGLLAGKNVLQNSWTFSFGFLQVGPLANYNSVNKALPGTYSVYLLARDKVTGEVVARTSIQVLVGGAPPVVDTTTWIIGNTSGLSLVDNSTGNEIANDSDSITFTATATDEYLNPKAGELVIFNPNSTGVTFTPGTSCTTGNDGKCDISITSTEAGTFNMNANVFGVPSATATKSYTFNAGLPAGNSTFTVSDTSQTVGLPITYSAAIVDVEGNPVADGYLVTFTLDDSPTGANADDTNATITCLTGADATGSGLCEATAANLFSTKVGTTRVNATVNDGVMPVSFGTEKSTAWTPAAFNINNSEYGVSTDSEEAGTAVTYTATLYDVFDNLVDNVNHSIEFSLSNTNGPLTPDGMSGEFVCSTGMTGTCGFTATSNLVGTTSITSVVLDTTDTIINATPITGEFHSTMWNVGPVDLAVSRYGVSTNSETAGTNVTYTAQVTDQYGNFVDGETVVFNLDAINGANVVPLTTLICMSGDTSPGICQVSATSSLVGDTNITSVTVDGQAITNTNYLDTFNATNWTSGLPAALHSTFAVSDTSQTVGEVITYSADIRDVNNNLVASGFQVTFTLNDNDISMAPTGANADDAYPTISCSTGATGLGLCEATASNPNGLTSTKVGTTRVTATVNDGSIIPPMDNKGLPLGNEIAFGGETSTAWTPAAFDINKSEYGVSTDSEIAGTTVTYTAILYDTFDNLVNNVDHSIEFILSNTNGPLTPDGLGGEFVCTTAMTGTCGFTATSNLVGTTSITSVVVDGDAINNTIQSTTPIMDEFHSTTWTPGVPFGALSSYGVNSTVDIVAGVDVTYSAFIVDEFGNNVEDGITVTFALANPDGATAGGAPNPNPTFAAGTVSCMTGSGSGAFAAGTGACSVPSTSFKVGTTNVTASTNVNAVENIVLMNPMEAFATTWIPGLANAGESDIAVTNNLADADGVSLITFTATISDVNGNLVNTPELVTFTQPADITLSSTTCSTIVNTGVCSITAKTTKASTYISTATINNGQIGGDINYEFIAGPVDFDKSFVTVLTDNAFANGSALNELEASLFDAFFNPVKNDIVSFAVTADVNFGIGTGIARTCNTGQAGSCSMFASSIVQGSYTTSVTVLNEMTMVQQDLLTSLGGPVIYQFDDGVPDITTSTVTASLDSIPADETLFTSLVSVQLQDSLGNILTSGTEVVGLTGTPTSSTITATAPAFNTTTNTYDFEVKSSNVDFVTYRATVVIGTPMQIDDAATVDFTIIDIDADNLHDLLDFNTSSTDSDGDGINDGADAEPNVHFINGPHSIPSATYPDQDNDGIRDRADVDDNGTDFDGDGINDEFDLDAELPIITMIGGDPITSAVSVEQGMPYTDLGATARDNQDGDITGDIMVITPPVDTSTLGDQTVIYEVTDSNNNTVTATRTVTVTADVTPPMITILGDNPLTVEAGSTYTAAEDAGATAFDSVDGVVVVTEDFINVDTSIHGSSFAVVYTASDLAGNMATASRTINVVDTISPVMTLFGDNPQFVEVNNSYTEANVNIVDNETGLIATIDLGGLDTDVLGTYLVTYTLTDLAGNVATPVTRLVTVRDTTVPTITLLGSSPITIELGAAYVDLGATADDTFFGNITSSLVTVSTVDINTIGDYTVRYNVNDGHGNDAVEVVRLVNVRDTTDPVITLNGSDSVTVELGSTYIDAGAVVTDNQQGLTATITFNDVDTSNVGTYTVTYSVTDLGSNTVTKSRTVIVRDLSRPVITLNGASPLTIESSFTPYLDQGASVADNQTAQINAVIDSSNVVPNIPNTYFVTFNATDAEGNVAVTVTRIVIVVDTVKPEITLLGGDMLDNSQTIVAGNPYVELGSTVSDIQQGLIAVVDSSGVNTNIVGVYDVFYNVTDSSGNVADTVVRSVEVVIGNTPDVTTSTVTAMPVTVAADNTTSIVSIQLKDSLSNNVSGGMHTVTLIPSSANATLTAVVDMGNGLYEVMVSDLFVETVTFQATVELGGTPATIDDTADVSFTIVDVDADNLHDPQDPNPANTDTDGDGINDGADAEPNVAFDPMAVNGHPLPTTYPDTDGDGIRDRADVDVDGNLVDDNGTDFDGVGINDEFDLDAVNPIISLIGDAVINIELGTAYIEQGATVRDNQDDVVAAITIAGDVVVTSMVGQYIVTYNVSDVLGNPAVEVTREVNVTPDATPPVITILGDNPLTIEAGSTYTVVEDAGATALDNVDGPVAAPGDFTVPFDTSTHGTSFAVVYTASDSTIPANTATASRMVNVVDSTDPIMTLIGANPQFVEVGFGQSYADPGVTIVDNEPMLSAIVNTGGFDSNVLGTYLVTYTLTDGAGNVATPVTRLVTVRDTTVPTISWDMNTPINVELGDTYVDAGASASDFFFGDITGSLVTVSSVDTNTVGNFSVTYNVNDGNGNDAVEVVREVNVVDTTAPIITLIGGDDITVELGSTYVDQGSVVIDNQTVELTATVTGAIVTNDDSLVGVEQTLTFTVTDAATLSAIPVIRRVTVVDTTRPVIDITGSNIVIIEAGGSYSEQGATVIDNQTASITASIVSNVNTSKPGTYFVVYSAVDTALNVAEDEIRIVIVQDNTAPVIMLVGGNVTMEAGTAYIDQGATVIDNEGDLLVDVDTSGLNTLVPGVYNVIYRVKDSSNNNAIPVTRVVTVVDTTAPTITLLGDDPQIVEAGTAYIEANATVDDVDPATTLTINATAVNTNLVDTYVVSYTAVDTAMNPMPNEVTVERTVNVVDTTPPAISLIGANPLIVQEGSVYTDPGANATDFVDDFLGLPLVVGIVDTAVDTSVLGDHIVDFSVTDSNGNNSTETRTVTVVADIPVATPDSYTVDEDGMLEANDADGTATGTANDNGVIANDTDPDNDGLTIVAANVGAFTAGGIGGDIEMFANGTFDYIPPAEEFGLATFSYEITDGTNIVASSLSIEVLSVNDAPSFTVQGNVIATGNVGVGNSVITIPGFVDSIVFGPSNESTQSVVGYSINSLDSANIISSATIDTNGQLKVDINFNNFGIAILQVTLQDDGGTDNSGDDTSEIVEFMVLNLTDNIFTDGFESIVVKTLNKTSDAELAKFDGQVKSINDSIGEVGFEFKGHDMYLDDAYMIQNKLEILNLWVKELRLFEDSIKN
jgi:hypothetical protein